MRIGCLQFNPQVGDVGNNIKRAEAILDEGNPKDLDLLVLPEMAFSGYNFKSLEHIYPYLEPTSAGISSKWAKTAALKYNCVVAVGYPEKADGSLEDTEPAKLYNSAIIVHPQGIVASNYRKTFLYYTDDTWAQEGPDGFFSDEIEGLGSTAMGICMDLNPYKFKTPWTDWEFAYHVVDAEANLVILSMAWSTQENHESYKEKPLEPDMQSVNYWLARLEPLIRGGIEGEIIVVLANRCGSEDESVYVGTSCVLGINEGEISVYGILGRGEEQLLVVDTGAPPKTKLNYSDSLAELRKQLLHTRLASALEANDESI